MYGPQQTALKSSFDFVEGLNGETVNERLITMFETRVPVRLCASLALH